MSRGSQKERRRQKEYSMSLSGAVVTETFPLIIATVFSEFMLHIQNFYQKEMVRHGLGRRSFNLDVQPSGEMVIHEVVGHGNWRDYKKSDGNRIREECAPILRRKGSVLIKRPS